MGFCSPFSKSEDMRFSSFLHHLQKDFLKFHQKTLPLIEKHQNQLFFHRQSNAIVCQSECRKCNAQPLRLRNE